MTPASNTVRVFTTAGIILVAIAAVGWRAAYGGSAVVLALVLPPILWALLRGSKIGPPPSSAARRSETELWCAGQIGLPSAPANSPSCPGHEMSADQAP